MEVKSKLLFRLFLQLCITEGVIGPGLMLMTRDSKYIILRSYEIALSENRCSCSFVTDAPVWILGVITDIVVTCIVRFLKSLRFLFITLMPIWHYELVEGAMF